MILGDRFSGSAVSTSSTSHQENHLPLITSQGGISFLEHPPSSLLLLRPLRMSSIPLGIAGKLLVSMSPILLLTMRTPPSSVSCKKFLMLNRIRSHLGLALAGFQATLDDVPSVASPCISSLAIRIGQAERLGQSFQAGFASRRLSSPLRWIETSFAERLFTKSADHAPSIR
jgi:hypothetical protein